MRVAARWAWMWGVILACATGLAQSVEGHPVPAGSLHAVLLNARARVEKSDVRATGRLTMVAANGTRVNNSLALASHSFPDELRTLITVTTPDHKRERYLLTQNENGHTSIDVLRPGDKSPTRLSPEHWGEGVAGTLFYPEDFADGQFFWTKQTVLPPAKYGARDCFVLKSEPGPGQPTIYASVTTWMDQKSGAPVYVEAQPRNGGPAKQFVFYDLEQIGGLWLSRQVEAKLAGKPGSTVLLIDHGSPHAHLTRRDFSLTTADAAKGEAGP